jgi:hypothetical protein
LRKDFDDDHAPTAARASALRGARLIWFGRLSAAGLRLQRHDCEQLPGLGNIFHPIAIGEKAVMADAVSFKKGFKTIY